VLPPGFGDTSPHSAVLKNTFADNGGCRLPFRAPLRGSFVKYRKQGLSASIPSLMNADKDYLSPSLRFSNIILRQSSLFVKH